MNEQREVCSEHAGICAQLIENTRLTKEIHVALLGEVTSERAGWIPRVAGMEKVISKVQSMAITASCAFIVAALGVIWALITHQVMLK